MTQGCRIPLGRIVPYYRTVVLSYCTAWFRGVLDWFRSMHDANPKVLQTLPHQPRYSRTVLLSTARCARHHAKGHRHRSWRRVILGLRQLVCAHSFAISHVSSHLNPTPGAVLRSMLTMVGDKLAQFFLFFFSFFTRVSGQGNGMDVPSLFEPNPNLGLRGPGP